MAPYGMGPFLLGHFPAHGHHVGTSRLHIDSSFSPGHIHLCALQERNIAIEVLAVKPYGGSKLSGGNWISEEITLCFIAFFA